MIKLNHLNKYYNKNKNNEVHVVNDISLTLEDKGLVVLLGSSGSGKTTLLNVIGGLDKVEKGAIDFDGKVFEKYNVRAWDMLRNHTIGYIFQNYYLLPQQTVKENIRLTLKMIGLDDEDEIDRRIDTLLEAVNMGNYKNRKANQLSGGQQQRVAIVRALAKNPKVLIADEPTGNLDSKNTLEIMRIIKSISKEKLVIMVTHEKELATHYADRIIELEDGKIVKDANHTSSGTLDTSQETDLYLKDFEHTKSLQDSDVSFKLYEDTHQDNLNVRFIIRNKTLYIDLGDQAFTKVHVIDKDSEVNILDRKKSDVVESDEEALHVDFNTFVNPQTLDKPRQVIPFKYAFKLALEKLQSASKLSRLLWMAFAFGAVLIAVSVFTIGNVVFMDESDYLIQPKNAYSVPISSFDNYEQFLSLRSHASIEAYNLYKEPFRFSLQMPFVYQLQSNVSVTANISPSSLLSESDMIHGVLPQTPTDIVIDKALADEWLASSQFKNRNITSYRDIVNIDYRLVGEDYDSNPHIFKNISGISNTGAPVIYLDLGVVQSLERTGNFPIELIKDFTHLYHGRLPLNEDEALVPLMRYTGGEPFESYQHTFINNGVSKQMTIVGVYDLIDNDEIVRTTNYAVAKSYMEELYFSQTRYSEIYLYANDARGLELLLAAENLEFLHLESYHRNLERSSRLGSPLLVFTIIAVVASVVSFYFIIRASLIQRIYEVGVYRALGVSRLDILKLFVIEAIMLTTVSSVVGFLAMTYILSYIENQAGQLTNFNISILTVTLGILLLYVTNVLSGIIPVYRLLRKTPAQINAQYDL